MMKLTDLFKLPPISELENCKHGNLRQQIVSVCFRTLTGGEDLLSYEVSDPSTPGV